jgi:hypothetical protein
MVQLQTITKMTQKGLEEIKAQMALKGLSVNYKSPRERLSQTNETLKALENC